MKNFEKVKAEYQEIKASGELKERVAKNMKNNKKKSHLFYKAAAAVACFAVLSVATLNVFPNVSYSMKDIPVLGKIVNVVTFRKYEHKENGYEAKVEVPKIEGLLNKELEDKLNEEFKEYANHVIAAYEADVKAMKEEFGDEEVHFGITSSYQIKTDNDEILALDVYLVNEVGSSSTKHTYYTIDKKAGKLLTLADCFDGKTDYADKISEYIREEMKRRNSEEDADFWIEGEENSFEAFEKIADDQKFYINNDGNVVICFDKYEVAPGYMGSIEFVIPNELV